MVYVDANVTVGGWTARLPPDHAGDADRIAACTTLASAAAPLYNDSLVAGDPARALELAYQAVRLFPYGAELLDYALTLSIHHGDFDEAAKLVRTATKLGLDDLATRSQRELEQAVTRWNQGVADPHRFEADAMNPHDGLRTHLARDHLSASEVTPPDPAVGKRTVRVGGPGWKTVWASAAAAVFVGLAIGFLVRGGGTTGSDPEALAPPPAVAEARAPIGGSDALTRAAEALSAGQPQTALSSTQGASGAVADVLREVAWTRSLDASEAPWRRQDYQTVAEVLGGAQASSNAPSEGLYRIAVAAFETGDSQSAHQAAASYLDHPDASDRASRQSQAAYIAAVTGQGETAVRYARLVRGSYANTIYDNSTIRAILRDDG